MTTNEGKELVDELLKEAGDFTLLGNAGEFRQQMLEQLEVIEKAAIGFDSGGGKVIVRGSHLRLSGTVWPLLTCTVAFALAPLDASGLTYAAAGGAVVNAFKELAKVFNKLDPAQQVVCRAVLDVAREKKIKGDKSGVSITELQDHFSGNGNEVPKTLDSLVTDLEKLGVLRKVNDEKGNPFYHVTF